MSSSSNCLFCKIAAGAIPAHRVHESPRVLAFLDIQPIREGHVVVILREHYPYFDALPPDVAHEILEVAQRLAPVLRERSKVERVAFMFTGTDIVQAHAHVLPMVEPTDVTSRRYIVEEQVTFRSPPRAADGDLAATAAALKAALARAPS